jgi:hypothetical protein
MVLESIAFSHHTKTDHAFESITLIQNSTQVRSNLIKFIGKKLVKILFFVTNLSGAHAQDFLHGTYFIAEVGIDYAVVAIDSRETRNTMSGQTVNDRYCKIRLFPKKTLFFSSGTTFAMDSATNALVFDSRDVAQQIF